jgi:hypothetical protein
MATVDIVIPSYRGMHAEANGPLMAMLQKANCLCRDQRGGMIHEPWKCPNGKHSVRLMPPTYLSSVIHWARNQVLALALNGQPQDGRPPADYFLLMDDDMVVETDYLQRLISYKQDIVAGICTVKRDPPRPNIRFWNAERHCFQEPIEWDWDSLKLMEIDGAGAAFMLVTRKVFERMAEAYLNCEFEIQRDLRKIDSANPGPIIAYWAKRSEKRKSVVNKAKEEGNWSATDCWWFEFLDDIVDNQVGQFGEDLSFCWKAKRLGFRIFADPQILPGHIGAYAYSIRDYRAYIEEAKKNGEEIPQRENKPSLVAA